MTYLLNTIVSFSIAMLVTFTTHAQEIRPLGKQPNNDEVQKQLVEELEALRNEIALAYNENKKIERDRLFEILKTAKSEAGGKYVADAIWRNWMASAPTPEVADMITKAMERRRWYDYEGAREILNEAIELAPDYSEVWNQRAYILFLQEKFDASLEDIERAIELEPRHFGALSGKARILFHQGRHQLAQEILKSAVDIHPSIFERFLLAQTPEPGQEPIEGKVGQEL